MTEAREGLLSSRKTRIDYKALGNFLAGCLLTFAASCGGINYLYVVQLKELLSFNQIQIETLAAVCIAGVFIALPFSAVHGRFGFYGTCLAGYLVTGPGFVLMGVAAALPETFSQLPFVVYFFQFLMSLGRCGLYFITRLMVLLLIPECHTGKAICGMTTMVFAAEVAFSALYNATFSSTEKVVYYFFITFAVITGAVIVYVTQYLVAYTCQASTERDQVDKHEEHAVTYHSNESADTPDSCKETSVENENNGSTDSCQTNQPLSLWELSASCKFQCFVWSGAILISAGNIVMINIGLIIQSLQMEVYGNAVVMTMLITCTVSRFVSGFVYDILNTRSKKIYIMVFICIMHTASFGGMLIWTDNPTVVFVPFVLCFIATGMAFPTYTSFTRVILGYENTATVKGALNTAVGLLIFVLSLVTGALNDHVGLKNGQSGVNQTCYGPECYWWAFLVIFVLLLFTPLLLILLLFLVKKEER